MTPLRIIGVPPEHSLPPEPDGLYQVILGDCVLPGHVLGKYQTAELADDAVRYFADHYKLDSHPCKSNRMVMPYLTLIQGGRSDQDGSADRMTITAAHLKRTSDHIRKEYGDEIKKLRKLLRLYNVMCDCPVCYASPRMTSTSRPFRSGSKNTVVTPTGWVIEHGGSCDVGKAIADGSNADDR